MGKYPIINTGSPELDRIVLVALYDSEHSIIALVDAIDRSTVEAARRKDQTLTGIIEQIRTVDAHLGLADRRALELRNLLTDGPTAGVLSEELAKLAVDESAFKTWLQDDGNLDRFTHDVPAIHVSASLMLARDTNRNHRTHHNDATDFEFFSVALPYANFVVAEKGWAHFANTTGLAKQYETVVDTDVRKLPQILRSAGCL